MKRGFLTKANGRIAQRKPPSVGQLPTNAQVQIPEKDAPAGDESMSAQPRELEFHFSEVCRLYSENPYIIVADYRLSSSSCFLYLPSENAGMVFIDSLDSVQAISTWQVLKEPCRPPPDLPFVIRSSGAKGLGMFATRPIARGALIMRERPVYASHPTLSVGSDQKHSFYTSALAGLAPATQAVIASLRNAQPVTSDVGHIRGILITNALGAKIPQMPDAPPFAVLFEHLCRANHDCAPNAHYGFCSESFSGRLFAVRSIAEGEEITIGYTDLTTKRAARREHLEAKFWFVCECATCSLPPAHLVESDARREAIGKYFALMKKGERYPQGASLDQVKELIIWAEEEGLVEAASILCISALRLAQRDDNYSEELKLMVSAMNYIRAIEGNESLGFATLAARVGLSAEQLAAILDNGTPETYDYGHFEGLLASRARGKAMSSNPKLPGN
ncbi:SET domain-containing protein [Mycena sanguinolenta]|uniref:SET domain-containing protein n=1 Tax=Mycena sanguinolenta TaxID=230812 RepID=A0A8H6ZCB6_9AGAR|nr:SET domain-containing protein [Mycena sanguinolenta]